MKSLTKDLSCLNYYADFVVWDEILFEPKAVEKLTDSHIKQLLNYLAASKLCLGLVVNFGGDSLQWERAVFETRDTRANIGSISVNW
jgi:GxxExxY protein